MLSGAASFDPAGAGEHGGHVVAEGTGQYAAMPGYQVAGKTGTAQKPDSHGGYATGRYVASFVGIVPASRPRFVILVAVDEIEVIPSAEREYRALSFDR